MPQAGERMGFRRAAGRGVEQLQVGGCVEQAALIELPLDLDQPAGQVAQQGDADRLVVDEAAAATTARSAP